MLIGGIGSDVVLADSYETDSINVVGANASNQIELGTVIGKIVGSAVGGVVGNGVSIAMNVDLDGDGETGKEL